MTDAVVASLPDFRRYLRAKARLLGHDGGLPWWDLFAPVGDAGEVEWTGATDARARHVRGLLARARRARRRARSPSTGSTPRSATASAAARTARRSPDDVSRVMMNFDGSHDSVSTLAHELGHAFHNVALADRTPMQRRTPMALAETASIFCETLLFETRRRRRRPTTPSGSRCSTRYLVGATQVVVDIHSRFLFETELCRRRRRTALSVAELNATMLDAQEAAYGDGLDPEHRHQYMWAVKPHYFTPFYNWPYTFGLLFGIGLYARYVDDPERFRAGYDDLLSTDGHGRRRRRSTAPLRLRRARRARSGPSSLAVIIRHIDDYERLAAEL